MIREMRKTGMAIGGHTVNHSILAQMSREQQCLEIERCGQRFAEELNEPMRYFSYPVGGLRAFNDDTRSCLRESGVQFAFSYYGGYRRFQDWDDYDIRRIAVESDTSSDLFRAMTTVPQVFCR
jgi:peptidoglycan/xylan/chitin deacetylase (PgdA/CDA1 family)